MKFKYLFLFLFILSCTFYDKVMFYNININCFEISNQPIENCEIYFISYRKCSDKRKYNGNLLGKTDKYGKYEKSITSIYGFKSLKNKKNYQDIFITVKKDGYYPSYINMNIPEIYNYKKNTYEIYLNKIILYPIIE